MELLKAVSMYTFFGAVLGLALGLLSPLTAREQRSLAAKRVKYGFWKAWGVEIGECLLGSVLVGTVIGVILFYRGEASTP